MLFSPYNAFIYNICIVSIITRSNLNCSTRSTFFFTIFCTLSVVGEGMTFKCSVWVLTAYSNLAYKIYIVQEITCYFLIVFE